LRTRPLPENSRSVRQLYNLRVTECKFPELGRLKCHQKAIGWVK